MVTENAIPLSSKLVFGTCSVLLAQAGSGVWPVFFACLGASIGVGTSKSPSVARAALLFVATVAISCLAATYAAQEWWKDTELHRNVLAVLFSAAFHLIWNVFTERVPKLTNLGFDLLEGWLQRWSPGGRKDD